MIVGRNLRRADSKTNARFRVWTIAFVILAVCAVLLLVGGLVRVLMVLFAGVLFGIFLRGTAAVLAKRTKLPMWAALGTVVVALLGITTGVLTYGVPQMSDQFGKLAGELDNAIRKVQSQVESVEWLGAVARGIPSPKEWLGNGGIPLDSARSAFMGVATAIGAVIVIAFVGLYSAASPGLYKRGIVQIMPVEHRERTEQLLSEIGNKMWWWLMGRLVSMSIIGVFTALGLWLLGVPLAALLGLWAAVLTFIPNIGSILAVIPPALIALEDGWTTSLYVIIFYTSLQFVESYIITPLIQKRAISLPPVLLLGTQLLLGVTVGAIGVVVAAPLTALGMLIVQRLHVDRLEHNGQVVKPREAVSAS